MLILEKFSPSNYNLSTSYYTTIPTFLQYKNMNNAKIPEQHNRLPYHFGEDIHLPLASLYVIVYKIGVRQRFLHTAEGVDGCLAVGKADGEHFKELLLKLFCGKVGGCAFDGVVELVDALPYDTAVFIVGVPGDGRVP